MSNSVEYLIRLKDEFTAKMQSAAGAAAKGGAAIGQGLAAAALAGLKFKDTISAGWDVLNGNYEALGDVLGALPGPLGEIGQIAGATLGAMITETEQAAEGYRKLSAATGASVEFLSGFKEAADDVRVSGEAVDSALTKFSKGLGGIEDVAEGAMASGKGVAGTLRDIGVAANDSEGKVRPLADVLPDVADAFSKMADGPQKTAIAIQLFGKQGAELIPILNKGKAGIADMAAEAKALGLTMSGDTIAAVDRLKKAQDALGDSYTGLSRAVGTAAIPALTIFTSLLNGTTEKVKAATDGNTDFFTRFLTFFSLFDPGTQAVAIYNAVLGETSATSEKAADGTDMAASALGKLNETQKDAATIQREYQDKVNDLTDAMGKRNDALEDLHEKERQLIEAEERGFITKEQLSAAQGHLRDQTEKVKAEFEAASVKIKDGATSTEAMGKAAENAVAGEKAFEQATKDAASAAQELKDKTDNLTDGFGKMPEKMDAAAKAAMAWKMATGQVTVAESEQELVARGLTAQYSKNKISLKELVEIGQQYRDGTISADEALQKSGAWKNVAFINVAKQYREIEAASGAASQSELAHADYITISTRRYVGKKASLDDLAAAQLDMKHNQEIHNEIEKRYGELLKNNVITEMDHQKMLITNNEELAAANAGLRKVEESYKAKSGAVTTSTTIIDKWDEHLKKAGITADEAGKSIAGMPDQKDIKISADASGLDDPKKEVEQLKQNAGAGANLPINANTTGLDKPKAEIKELSKPVTVPITVEIQKKDAMNASILGGNKTGVSVAVDTSTVDQSVKKINDVKLDPKVVSISADYDRVMNGQNGAFDVIAKYAFETKVVEIDGDETKVWSVFDAIDAEHLLPKTVSVYGDNGSAMAAITAVKSALASLHDKTVYVNVVQGGPPANSSGSPDDRDNPDREIGSVRNRGDITGGKLADTIIVRSDLDLEVLSAAVARRLNGG